MEQTIDRLVNWLRETVYSAGSQGIVFGLSGGVDSAVIAGLAKLAFPNNSLGVIMPIQSAKEDEEDAILVANALNLEVVKVDLTNTFSCYLKDTFVSNSVMAKSNIKPRLRMITLYYFGQDRNYLVSGSSNGSEFYIGYYTKYGDSGSDILPLVSFLKDEVYDLARALNIPDKIINKQPTAGLWEGQTDEDEMGFSYKELNDFIRLGIEGPNSAKIKKMHENSKHKREFVQMFKK